MTTKAQDALRRLIDQQAECEALWFAAKHASEAYLQQALRDLHSVAEHALATEQAELTREGNVSLHDNNADVIEHLREALLDAVANLTGAADAYRIYCKRHISQGKAETDAFFSTRCAQFDAAVERGHKALVSDRAIIAASKAKS